MNICTDCKHCIDKGRPLICKNCNTLTKKINPVDGSVIERSYIAVCKCWYSRKFGWFWTRILDVCGKEGRWFEDKLNLNQHKEVS